MLAVFGYVVVRGGRVGGPALAMRLSIEPRKKPAEEVTARCTAY